MKERQKRREENLGEKGSRGVEERVKQLERRWKMKERGNGI